MAAIKVKIVDGGYENFDAVEKTINYALRLGDMHLVGGLGVALTNVNDIAEQFHVVKRAYSKTTGKQVVHIIFSVAEDTYLKVEHVKKLGYLLAECFGCERRVVFGVHTDTGHLHIHMVINTVAYTNGAYCGYYDIRQLNGYAGICMRKIMDEVWFGKETDLVAVLE